MGLLILILSIYILIKQKQKILKITISEPYLPYNDTYCKPFLKKVRIVKYF